MFNKNNRLWVLCLSTLAVAFTIIHLVHKNSVQARSLSIFEPTASLLDSTVADVQTQPKPARRFEDAPPSEQRDDVEITEIAEGVFLQVYQGSDREIQLLTSAPYITDKNDLYAYQEHQAAVLNELKDDETIAARVTFYCALSEERMASVLGPMLRGAMLTYRSYPEGGGSVPASVSFKEGDMKKFEDMLIEKMSEFGGIFSLFDGFTSASIRATPEQLQALAENEQIFLVDVGPRNHLAQYPEAFISRVDHMYHKLVRYGSDEIKKRNCEEVRGSGYQQVENAEYRLFVPLIVSD